MAELQYVILARTVSIDQITGFISIFELIDKAKFSSNSVRTNTSAVKLEFVICSSWIRDSDENEINVVVRAKYPDGTVGKRIPSKIVFDQDDDVGIGRSFGKFQGITWKGPGFYEFQVFQVCDEKDELKGSAKLLVVQEDDPEGDNLMPQSGSS